MQQNANLFGAFLVLCSCYLSWGYPQGNAPRTGSLINSGDAGAALAQQQYIYAVQAQQQALQANLAASQQAALQRIYLKDPWRSINGQTNYAAGDGWFEFQGLPQGAGHDGTTFKGKWGAVLTVCPVLDQNHLTTAQNSVNNQAYNQKTAYPANATPNATSTSQRSSQYSQGVQDTSVSHAYYGDDIFLVANFPYPATQPYQEMLAHDAGYYTFTNVDDQVVTVHKLDYGSPCTKIWSPEELAAIKDRIEAPKKAAAAKALKSNQDAAGQGDAYGLLRMGERYRDGDGVEQNLAKARDYLQKSADAGSPTAAEELKKLPAVPQ